MHHCLYNQKDNHYQDRARRSFSAFTAVLYLLIGLFLFPGVAGAQSEELYGSSAPEDAAFVRVFNYRSSGTVSSLKIGSIEFQEVEVNEATAYRPVNPGVHAVYLGEAHEEIIAGEESYYTVLLGDEGPKAFEDPIHTRADRAQIILYNVSMEKSIELRTADGENVIIESTAKGESEEVVVNPVEAELAVFVSDNSDSGDPEVSIGDIDLERGQSYGLFALETGDPCEEGSQNGAEVIIRRGEVLTE
ncbi:MAG: alginate O-acetyltransferase AlgF [Spirochaetia bacterium]